MIIGRSNQDKNWDSFGMLLSTAVLYRRVPYVATKVLYIDSFNKYLLIIYYNPGTSLNYIELIPYGT